MRSPVRLKQASGWFAAGEPVRQAARLLSDGAFKLFIWLCLHAERASGMVYASAADLAGELEKSDAAIICYLQELVEAGICRVTGLRRIEIQDAFWPYCAEPAGGAPPGESYVAAVRRLFLGQGCVHSSFPPSDQQLAGEWDRRGVPLQTVERAILLGCLRKYVTLVNHGGGPPITTLHYFSNLIEEVSQTPISPGYWNYLAHRVKDCELRWRQLRPPVAGEPTGQRERK
jgi:hypothetical protein